jgi:hypothetical protein
MAGSQMEGTDPGEAIQKVKRVIDQMIEEGEIDA